MTPAQLSRTVQRVLLRAVSEGELSVSGGAGDVVERVVVESPPRRGDGDYATGVAHQVAARAGRPARDVAELLRERLVREPGIADAVAGVRVVGPGFLNVTLSGQGRGALVGALGASAAGARDVRPYAGQPVTDRPAPDIARWAAATGEEPARLRVRTARASSLFRVQYAHARTRALLREAWRLGFGPVAGDVAWDEGRSLLALLADQERVQARVRPRGQAPGRSRARADGQHRDGSGSAALARHLDAVAAAFWDFHDSCPPLPSGDEKPGAAHRGRLALAEATGAVLAGGLAELGVTAPDRL